MKPKNLSLTVTGQKQLLGEREARHLETKVASLDRWTRHHPTRSLCLNLTQIARTGECETHLVLELSSATLSARATATEVLAAIDLGFRKVLRQLREHLAHLRRERWRGNGATPGAADSITTRERFEAHLGGHLHHLRRRLQQVLETNRCDPPLEVDDLVEETIAEALVHFDQRPSEIDVRTWLDGLAFDVFERARALQPDPSVALSGEGDVPTPPSLSDHDFDGLHRLLFRGEIDDDGVRPPPVVDPHVRAPTSRDPALAAEDEDERAALISRFQQIPKDWRDLLRLHHIEGYDPEDIAQIKGTTTDDVRFNLRSAELLLRDQVLRG